MTPFTPEFIRSLEDALEIVGACTPSDNPKNYKGQTVDIGKLYQYVKLLHAIAPDLKTMCNAKEKLGKGDAFAEQSFGIIVQDCIQAISEKLK